MAILDSMPSKGVRRNIGHYNIALFACAEACAESGEFYEKAEDLFSRLKSEGHTPDKSTYNSLLLACSKLGKWQRVQQLMENMRRSNVPFDAYTYNAAISACSRVQPAPKVEVALELCNQMKADGIKPTLRTFNNLLRLYHNNRMWREALIMLDK